MSKKFTLATALCVLALCCGFVFKKHHAAPQAITVVTRSATVVPITILSAIPTASGLAVQVRNDADAQVEYFELRLEGCRVWAGRSTIDVETVNHPKWFKQELLILKPGETRTFDFPDIKIKTSTIYVYMVLLSNGKGFLKGGWLKKLDKAKADGLLWDADSEETAKHLIKQTSKREFPRNVGKSASLPGKQGGCLRTDQLVRVVCEPSYGNECRIWRHTYEEVPSGVFVNWLTSNCYIPFDPFSCAYEIEDFQYGSC